MWWSGKGHYQIKTNPNYKGLFTQIRYYLILDRAGIV